MEWYQKYPKSYSSFLEFVFDKHLIIQNPRTHIFSDLETRWMIDDIMISGVLYEFFDKQGIWVNVNKSWSGSDIVGIIIEDEFTWEVFSDQTYIDSPYNSEYKTRVEAECAAFEKAFEILESKL